MITAITYSLQLFTRTPHASRVSPSLSLLVAIDGPAAAAKVAEQRRRRRQRMRLEKGAGCVGCNGLVGWFSDVGCLGLSLSRSAAPVATCCHPADASGNKSFTTHDSRLGCLGLVLIDVAVG